MFPAIVFDYMEAESWATKDGIELYKETEKLRKAVKKAAAYSWDSSNFYVQDIGGVFVLQVQFDREGGIHFWLAHNHTDAGHFSPKNPLTKKKVKELIENAGKGLTLCSECQKWHRQYVPYGFCGAACGDCYNPKKHRQPDSGD